MQKPTTATTLTTTALTTTTTTTTTPATRPTTPGQAVPLGTPLAPTVAVPPHLAQQNQQFAAQFPKAMSTLTEGQPEATPPLVAVTIGAVVHSPNHFDLPKVVVHVHVPSSMARDGESCDKLGLAVHHYLKSIGAVGLPQIGPNGVMTLDISVPYQARLADLDSNIAEINSAAALVHHLGFDSRCLIDLLNGVDFETALVSKFCRLFFGAKGSFFGDSLPTFQMYKHEGQIRVEMLRKDDLFVQDSIGACASWLSELGLKTLARQLLAEAIQGLDTSYFDDMTYFDDVCYRVASLCPQYLTLLLEGDLLADKAEAAKAVELLASRLDDGNVKWESEGGAFKICGPLVTRLCSDEACHPELAWKLLQHIYPPPNLFDKVEDEGCAKALAALFLVAMQKAQSDIAQGAINALRVMKGPSAEKAFEACRPHLQAHETIQALGDDNPHRQKLRAAGFEFRFGTSRDIGRSQSLFVLHPTALVKEDAGKPSITLKTGEPPTQFVAKKHGQALVDYALALALPATGDSFAASCFVAVAEFLFQHYSALPQAVQVGVLGGLADTVVEVISVQCVSARKSGPASTPAIVACLPMFVEAQILNFASTRLRELVEAENEDGVDNLIRWIEQHKQQLFGHLPTSMLPAGLQGLVEGEDSNPRMVDEDQARAEMKPLSARLFALIAELVDSGSISHSDDVADALFGYWMTFTGSNDRLGYHTARVQHDANRPSQGSSKEWSVTKKVAEDAQQVLGGSSDAGSQVAFDLYKSLIDLVAGTVQVHMKGDHAAEVAAWAIQLLQQLGANQQLLGSMSQVNPNAAIWPQLACVPVLLREEKFATAHNILQACASKPDVTWDSHFAVAFEATIKYCLSLKLLHPEAVQLFMLRRRCIDGSDVAPQLQQLDKQTLLALVSIIHDSLIHDMDPGPSPEVALCALLVELLALSPEVARMQLEAVLSAPVRSNHPTLAARVYLAFAQHYFAQGDKQAMLNAFSTALTNAPKDEIARAEVQWLCREFFKVVESSKEGDDEWPDTIQALMSYDKV